MADIVERLRSSSPYLHGSSAECTMMEAAAEIERLTEAHEQIVEWSQAYPLAIFPEPDLKKARALLEAGGMTLDALSAHAMRHVIEQVAEISRAALERKP